MDYVTETLVAVIWVVRNNQAMWYVHSGVVVLGFDCPPGLYADPTGSIAA